jgi:hypothetical protein
MKIYLLLVYLFCLSGLPADRVDPAAKDLKILYVGNSLTYANDLPVMVSEIAAWDKTKISFHSYCFPDYSLEDHWNEGKVKEEIEKGNYDYVIAQQGPSGMLESRIVLTDYAKKIAELCANSKSRLIMYMVWPSKARIFDLDNVIQSYTIAAEKSGSLLAPAGLAWKNAWQRDPALPLYSADDFHPSTSGSLLAAYCIYGVITGRNDFNSIPISIDKSGKISSYIHGILKDAARKALKTDAN